MWTTLHLPGLEQRPVLDRLLSDVRPLGAGQAGWPSSVRYARSKHMGDMGNASVTFGVSRVSSTDRSIYSFLQVRLPFHSGSYLSARLLGSIPQPGISTGGLLQTAPDIISCHAIRANLFASAT